MTDELEPPQESSNILRNVLLGIAAVYVIASLYLMFDMRGRLEKAEQRQVAAEAETGKTISATRAEFKADVSALASQVGMTQKQLASRAAQLQREQRDSETRLAEQQKQQITAVAGDVAGVKTEVGAVKTHEALYRTELENHKNNDESTNAGL